MFSPETGVAPRAGAWIEISSLYGRQPNMRKKSFRPSPRRTPGSVRLEAGAIQEVEVLFREMPVPGSQR